jgi:hypothetical protein
MILNSLNYRKRLRLLAIASIVIVFLCYRFSIHNTIEEYSKYSEMIGKKNESESSTSPEVLKTKEERINSIYNQFILDTLAADKNLLAISSDYCKKNNLVLKEYQVFNIFDEDSVKMLTMKVTVEGGFVKCLKLIYNLEHTTRPGHLSSVEFRTTTNITDKSLRLECTIYIQNLIV